MAVLKQTSPTASPSAPKPRPQTTVPSARTNTPVAPEGAGVGLASAMVARTPIKRLARGPNDVAKPRRLETAGGEVNPVKPAAARLCSRFPPYRRKNHDSRRHQGGAG